MEFVGYGFLTVLGAAGCAALIGMLQSALHDGHLGSRPNFAGIAYVCACLFGLVAVFGIASLARLALRR